MKTRSLGIAFAALLAIAPVRSSTAAANAPAAGQSGHPTSFPRPSISPKATEAAPTPVTESGSRKPRRHAGKQVRRHAYWEPFPIYWPSYHRHHLAWRRVAWFGWS